MNEKKPDFSNVVGGSSSTADAPAGKPAAAPRTYVVQKGDSLSKIAKQFYGSTDRLEADLRRQPGPHRRSGRHPARMAAVHPGRSRRRQGRCLVRSRAATTGLLALALGAAMVLGCKKEQPPPTQAPPGSPTPSVTAVRVTEVQLGKAVGADKRVENPTESFNTKDVIFASVVTEGTAPSAELTARWTYQDGQVVNETKRAIAPTAKEITEFSIQKPDGWPAGQYTVAILLDGKPVESKTFKVQ